MFRGIAWKKKPDTLHNMELTWELGQHNTEYDSVEPYMGDDPGAEPVGFQIISHNGEDVRLFTETVLQELLSVSGQNPDVYHACAPLTWRCEYEKCENRWHAMSCETWAKHAQRIFNSTWLRAGENQKQEYQAILSIEQLIQAYNDVAYVERMQENYGENADLEWHYLYRLKRFIAESNYTNDQGLLLQSLIESGEYHDTVRYRDLYQCVHVLGLQ